MTNTLLALAGITLGVCCAAVAGAVTILFVIL